MHLLAVAQREGNTYHKEAEREEQRGWANETQALAQCKTTTIVCTYTEIRQGMTRKVEGSQVEKAIKRMENFKLTL